MKPGAVFVDLQGTLGGDGLGDVMGFTFYPSAAAAIALLNATGLSVVVITNQSRIAKGYLTRQDFDKRMEVLKEALASQRAHWDAVYCCPHTRHDGCSCRKPLPGMIVQAQRDFDLDLSRCYLIGDTGAWDMKLARAVGCRAVLVRTGLGEGSLAEYRHLWADIEPDFIAEDVLEAARWIVGTEAP